MKLVAFEIPDDPAEIARWLETVLCHGDLRGLVAQLGAVADNSYPPANLNDLVGEQRDSMLQQGLGSLSHSQIRMLLCNPSLLLQLQETVMLDGGPYWQAKFASSRDSTTVEATRRHLQQLRGVRPVQPSSPEPRQRTWSISMLTAIAASLLLVAFGIWRGIDREPVPLASGWGWGAANGIPKDANPQDYLLELAHGADAWFDRHPNDAVALEKRLAEFQAGCERLIAAPHSALSNADRSWLLYKCRGWRTELEAQRNSVGKNPFDNSLGRADTLAKQVSKALRERAAQV